MTSPPAEEELEALIADEGGLLHTGDSDLKEGPLGSPRTGIVGLLSYKGYKM